MELSIFACRGPKILLFIVSVLVHWNISQTQHQNECKKREVCKVADDCDGGHDMVTSGNYKGCSFKNYVPGICCKPIRKRASPSLTTPAQQEAKPPSKNNRDQVFKTTTKRPMRTTTEAPTTLAPTTRENSTAVALKYCKEYAKYRYEETWEESNSKPGGDSSLQTRIYNGKPVSPKEYPHMALIGYVDEYNNRTAWGCGGSLISENFILSAAHCSAHHQFGQPKRVLLGDLNFTTNEDDAKSAVYSIVRVYNHPNYNKKIPPVHDIALFQLNTTVKLGPYVRPACLYTSTSHLVGTWASITGWGRTGTTEARSNHLLKANVSVIEDEKCIEYFPNYNTATMICAVDLKDGNDHCEGDSGGPLQVPIRNEIYMWDIIGVISQGPAICGSKEIPSVYTKVAVYLDWIQPIVWP